MKRLSVLILSICVVALVALAQEPTPLRCPKGQILVEYGLRTSGCDRPAGCYTPEQKADIDGCIQEEMSHPLIAFAQEPKALATKPEAKSAPPRTVSLSATSLQVYTDAQKRTDEARKLVESSPVWKDYLIAQNQQQSALLFVMAENGVKPSDGCKPIGKDGKVLTEGGQLDHFECDVKPEKPEPKK